MKTSPYYQLYGPPPSYESVISETLAEQNTTQQQDVSITRNTVEPPSNVHITQAEAVPLPSSLGASSSLQSSLTNDVPTTSRNGCNEIPALVTSIPKSGSFSKNADCK